MAISKFGLFSDTEFSFVTYLIVQVTCRNPVTQYIYGSNLVMICQSVRELCMKMH